jgi:hypothetical protein
VRGTEWTANTERAFYPKVVKGKIGEERADGRIVRSCRYIAFKGPSTRLVFDMNPKGLFTSMDYGGGGFLALWTIDKVGDYLEFSCGYIARQYGLTLAGKVLVYEGEYDWPNRHAMKEFGYFTNFPFERRYCAAPPEERPGWTQLTPKGGTNATWEGPGDVVHRGGATQGLLGTALTGRGEKTLCVEVPAGVYFVTLETGVKSDPFDVLIDGELKAEAVSATESKPLRLLVTAVTEKPELRLTLRGRGTRALSTLQLQPMIYQYEDFAFTREAWLVPGLYIPGGVK